MTTKGLAFSFVLGMTGLICGCVHLPKVDQPQVVQPIEHIGYDLTTYQIAMTILPEAIQTLKDCGKWPVDRLERVRITREYTDQIVSMLDANIQEADILKVFKGVCEQ